MPVQLEMNLFSLIEKLRNNQKGEAPFELFLNWVRGSFAPLFPALAGPDNHST